MFGGFSRSLMIKIFLDSNIFIEDFTLQGPHFHRFFTSINSIDYRLCIPEIVFEEVCQHYDEFITTEIQSFQKRMQKLDRFLPWKKDKLAFEVKKFLPDNPSYDYKSWFRERLANCNTIFIPHPEIDKNKLISSVLQKKKPFKKSDAGLKDYIIWNTILQDIQQSEPCDHVFVTKNKADFFDGQDLHPDLRSDLEESGIDLINFSLFENLENFFEEMVKPTLSVLENFKASLQAGTFTAFNIQDWFQENCHDLLDDDIIKMEILNLPFDFEGLTIFEYEYSSLEVNKVYEFDHSSILIYCKSTAKVIYELEITSEEFHESEIVKNMFNLNREQKFNKIVKTGQQSFLVEFSILFDFRTGDISDFFRKVLIPSK